MADLATAENPFLATAMARWRTAQNAEEEQRKEGELDLRFLNLQQWDDADERDRLAENKPTLVIDQIGEPYRQLNGQMRSARPALQVNPVDNGADLDTAEVFQGLIRHVEVTGGAKAAREEAFKGATGPGWGYYRLLTEYEYDQDRGALGPALFDQCITYQPIENQFTVFDDPAAPLHQQWKRRFCLVIEDVPKDEFEQRWPGKASTQEAAFQATGLQVPDWFPEGSVRVADYYYVEESDGPEIAQLGDGSVVPANKVPKGADVLMRRKPTVRTVKLAKITGAEVLEGNDDLSGGRAWPGKYIPVVKMCGESLTVNGKRNLRGIVRAARDPQRMYNFQNSELVHELTLPPKSKVLMAEGQMEGYEKMWEQAPVKAYPALFWKPTTFGGEVLPPPQIAQFTDANKIQALVVAINQHKSDLRSTTGYYDTTDPNRKNSDQSGRAILARKEAQSESSVNYKDNFGEALLYEGMILLDLIPKIYHRTGRILRILGEDDRPVEPVTVGQPWKRKSGKSQGVEGIFQWGAGRFDVTVSIGASYTTRRQEAADTNMQLVEVLAKTHPPMAAAIAPSVIRNMDIPGSQELADKAERTLPPEIRGDEDEGEDNPEALKAGIQARDQKLQEMGGVIQQLQEAVKTDQVKSKADLQKAQMSSQADLQKTQQSDQVKLQITEMEIASKERIEAAKIEADFRLQQMKLEADLEKARITAAAQAQARREQFGMDVAAGERQHVHEMEGADVAHTHALEQQAAEPNGSANA